MPVAVVIEAVQWTPDRDPVVIQYAAPAPATSPLARSQQLHTTQTALAARSGTPDYWGDAEAKAELRDYLAANGITADVVANTVNPDPAPDA